MYVGIAKLENVEFANCGQRGFVEDYDPRFALAFMDVGDTRTSLETQDDLLIKDSWVKSCSFNYNYNAAIGVYGSTKNLEITDNVVYRAYDNGAVDKSTGN